MMKDDDLHEHLRALSAARLAAPEYLAQRIESNLPDANPVDRILGWLSAAIWRSAIAVSVPIALGLSAGAFSPPSDSTERSIWYISESLVFADNLKVFDDDEI